MGLELLDEVPGLSDVSGGFGLGEDTVCQTCDLAALKAAAALGAICINGAGAAV